MCLKDCNPRTLLHTYKIPIEVVINYNSSDADVVNGPSAAATFVKCRDIYVFSLK